MASKIYVENLPVDITEDRLKDNFAQIGPVESVKIKTDLLSRRPKGSGYVEMALDVDAYRAVNCFNGAVLKDRKIYLKEAKPFYARAKDLIHHRVIELAQKTANIKRDSQHSH
jgi:RNA recognition motif-containing protein